MDEVEQFRELLQDAISNAYKRGYADAMAGKAPEHAAGKMATRGRRKRTARVSKTAKRGRLPKGAAEEWVRASMTAEWQKPTDIAEAIRSKHGRNINPETLRQTLRKLTKEKAISRHPKIPQYKAAA